MKTEHMLAVGILWAALVAVFMILSTKSHCAKPSDSRCYLDNEAPKPFMEHDLRHKVLIGDTLRGDWTQTNAVSLICIGCVISGQLDSSLADPSFWIDCVWLPTATATHTDFDGAVFYRNQFLCDTAKAFKKAQFRDAEFKE